MIRKRVIGFGAGKYDLLLRDAWVEDVACMSFGLISSAGSLATELLSCIASSLADSHAWRLAILGLEAKCKRD